jgi:hypothetical protein
MPGDLLDGGAVDDHLGLGHPHRHDAPDVPPRHGVAVLAVGDQALGVDRAVDHGPDVIRLGWQWDQGRPLFLVQLPRRLPRFPQLADVSDVRQPPESGLVELVERLEGAAVEQAGLDVEEGAFHLPLGLGASRPARDRPEAVVGGEGEEPRVIDRHIVLVAGHHHLHVVIETRRRDPA